MRQFDIVVVGGGHAGIEAAMAGARMGCSVGLVTMEIDGIGRMSCNPAIGGTAKGHLVYEIDALGGVMGEISDRTGIQFRILNKSKGPAVWASRCQSDMNLYSADAVRVVSAQNGIIIIEGMIQKALAEGGKIVGCVTNTKEEIGCKTLILACGTFLNGLMYTGLKTTVGGRYGESAAVGLTESLKEMGFEVGRLKTGTPVRIRKDSVDFSSLKSQAGDDSPIPFSMRTDKTKFPFLPQIACGITYTNLNTHNALRKGFDQSPLFTGRIKGIGPRYCPSVEDKVVRFSSRDRHQLFLEPQGLTSDLIYVNGFSSSLPAEVQLEALHTILGLEKAQVVRFGYAVEYDFFPPHQVHYTLETRRVQGLYFSGQINGTSGYEEAAAQGLVAGINAALKVQGRKEFTLRRDQAYIGVLIDDLINKSTLEPYRMFTSRAEHRLLLRQDNADRRLLNYGYEFGLITKDAVEELRRRENLIEESKKAFFEIRLNGKDINPVLQKAGTSTIESVDTVANLCKRPQLHLQDLIGFVDKEKHPAIAELSRCPKALEEVEIEIKYEGYIEREEEMIVKFEKLEEFEIPSALDYSKIKGLSAEAREKLGRIRPQTLGQASRIPGITPADVSVVMIYLHG